jgi:hypothetical protein
MYQMADSTAALIPVTYDHAFCKYDGIAPRPPILHRYQRSRLVEFGRATLTVLDTTKSNVVERTRNKVDCGACMADDAAEIRILIVAVHSTDVEATPSIGLVEGDLEGLARVGTKAVLTILVSRGGNVAKDGLIDLGDDAEVPRIRVAVVNV